MRPGIVFDQGRHHKAEIGFVLVAAEQTIEDDMVALAPVLTRH